MTRSSIVLGVMVGLFVMPSPSAAQRVQAEITGVVRDATGGVLPGVTVEASSPALIEKVRTVVTDGSGGYRFLDLRPGVYTVTFTLAGFSVVKREGVELTANFTATINADLRVGEISETITVSGQSPVVDVQNVVQQRVLTRDVIEVIPTGKYYQNYAVLTPAVVFKANVTNSNADVGGTLGNVSAQMIVHGSRGSDQQYLLDGMSVNGTQENATGSFNPADGNIEEFNFLIGANPAEAETGGVRINMVPREGSNRFRGAIFLSGTNSSLQSENVDDELVRAGLSAPNRLLRQYDIGPTFGGPVKQDKLWFFGSYRYFPNYWTVGGVSYSKDPKAWVYEADPTRPGVQDSNMWDANVRVTWQAATKHKVTGFFDYNYQCDCHRYISATRSPEASVFLEFWNKIAQTTWSTPVTNKLLLEAGASIFWWDDKRALQPEATEPQIVEQARNLSYRSSTGSGGPATYPGYNRYLRGSISYVTGGHSMKVGVQYMGQYINSDQLSPVNDISYRVLNGVPNQVTYWATPYNVIDANDPNIGIFAQDQWVLNRLTLNYGLRFDWLKSWYGALDIPPTRYMAARQYPRGEVANWKDLSPRLSAAYDVFGNGRTALKVSMSRYVLQQGRSYIAPVSPINSSNPTTSRTWTDLNTDFVVQGDPFNTTANGELGPQQNLSFGQSVLTFFSDPELDRGFGVRPYNWETSAGVQHELMARVSLSATYYRRWFGNFVVTDDLLRDPADFDSFCITAPSDARLPNGGGYPVCGLYDVKPAKFGGIRNFRTSAERFGKQTENWNGVDLTLNARLGNGVILQGGMATGKTATDACEIANTRPDVTYSNSMYIGVYAGNSPVGVPPGQFCHTESPWLTNVKFIGSLPIPGGFQLAATFQNIPGAALYANYVVTNAVASAQLGRNLAAGANSSLTYNIVDPGTMYHDRFNQVDIRATKDFTVGAVRIRGMVDLYNAFNANTVIAANNTYGTNGAAWLVPQVILAGRIVKFGGQLSF